MQPNESELQTTAAWRPDPEIPLGIRRSQEAFRRDLRRLLQDRRLYRRWVAYHGDERVGFSPSKRQLYQECLRRGLRPDEFVVRCIQPEAPGEMEIPLDV
jgi:hypothetical protein